MTGLEVAGAYTFWRWMCGDGPISKASARLVETVAEQIGQGMHTANDWFRTKVDTANRRTSIQVEVEQQAIRDRAADEAKLAKLQRQEERAVAFHEIQSKRRQRNLDRILVKAAEETQRTPDPEVADGQKVDPDWTTQFFNYSQDVSDEQMQNLWAKLLAGEVKRPGSFSRRTLDVVRKLSKDEAELFGRLCSFIWREHNSFPRLLIPQEWVDPKNRKFGLSYEYLQLLEEAGFISVIAVGERQLFFQSTQVMLTYIGEPFWFSRQDVSVPPLVLTIGQSQLTKMGVQLAGIAACDRNEEYRRAILEHYRKTGWTISTLFQPVVFSSASPVGDKT